jgi:WD40 repeat protein/serine/threonine protein kinase
MTDGQTKIKPNVATTYYQSIKERSLEELEAQVSIDWWVGDVILDLYEVTGILGEGGMGVVYKVHHRGWNLDLAVKAPKAHIFASEKGKQDFIREAETWVNLGLHPHIATCHYVRTLGGVPRLFAEYCEGGSLEDWIQSGRLYEGGKDAALERILDIAIQMAWGLSYAHEKGVVHQDVKPDNVLMTPDGTAKVTDFGLTGSVGGYTPAYCSPEQAESESNDHRSDIWSWGLSVLQMFAGRVFWHTVDGNTGILAPYALENYLAGEWENQRQDDVLPDMQEILANILQDCFLENPQERLENMDKVVEKFKEVFQQEVGFPYSREKPQPTKLLADSLNNRAVSLLEIGEEEKAIACWQEALANDPHHLETTFNYGYHRWQSGQITDDVFVTRLKELEGSQDDQQNYWQILFAVHLKRGDMEAIEMLQKAGYEPSKKVQDAIRNGNHARYQCLRTFEGHAFSVKSVSFSPDGCFALSGSLDSTLRLWDVESGECLRIFRHFGGAFIQSVAFSPDGRFVLSGSDDKTLRLWEVETGACLHTFEGHTKGVESVSFSLNGRLALSGSWDKTLRLWETKTGQCLRIFEGTGAGVLSVCFSPDATLALSGCHHAGLKLWDISTGKTLRFLFGHKGAILSVSFSPNGQFALSGSYDKTMRLWEVETGQCLRIFEGHSDAVLSVCFSPDGHFALSGSKDDTLRLWEIETGQCLRTFEGHNDQINSISFSLDGRFVLSGNGNCTLSLWEVNFNSFNVLWLSFPQLAKSQSSVHIQHINRIAAELLQQAEFELANGQPSEACAILHKRKSYHGYGRDYDGQRMLAESARFGKRSRFNSAWHLPASEKYCRMNACFSPDGRFVLSGSDNTTLCLWEIETGQCLCTFEGHSKGVRSVCFSPDGQFALSSGWDKTLRLWNVITGENVITLEGHKYTVNSVSFSPDGQFVLSGGYDKTMRLWDIETGRCLHIFEGHKCEVHSVSFSPDGRFVLSGNHNTTLCLWEIKTGQCLRTFEGHTEQVGSVSFSPDGLFALSGSWDKTLRLWSVVTGENIVTFEGHTEPVTSVCFSPDGQFALSGSYDKTMRLWDIETGQCLHIFEGHKDKIYSVSFSPDGRFAFSGLRLWEADWELEFPNPVDWDEGTRHYLRNFLTLQVLYAGELPDDREPTKEEITLALTRRGKPRWTEDDFQTLISDLQLRGYGWLRPEGVRKELIKMTREWQDPPPLPGQ